MEYTYEFIGQNNLWVAFYHLYGDGITLIRKYDNDDLRSMTNGKHSGVNLINLPPDVDKFELESNNNKGDNSLSVRCGDKKIAKLLGDHIVRAFPKVKTIHDLITIVTKFCNKHHMVLSKYKENGSSYSITESLRLASLLNK